MATQKPKPTAEKTNTVSSSKTVSRKADDKVGNFTEQESKVMNASDATDVSIAGALKHYMTTMAAGKAVKLPQDEHTKLWRTIVRVVRSKPEDFNRRMNILMHYVGQMVNDGGALTGSLPYRQMDKLSIDVPQTEYTHVISFLMSVGKPAKRRVALKNTNLDRVVAGLPPAGRDLFKQYFQLIR